MQGESPKSVITEPNQSYVISSENSWILEEAIQKDIEDEELSGQEDDQNQT